MASDAPDAFKDLGLEFLWSYVAANQAMGASVELILHGLKDTPEYSAPFPGNPYPAEDVGWETWDEEEIALPVWVVVDPGCEECGWGCRPVGGLYPSEGEAQKAADTRNRDICHYCEVIKIPED